MTTSDETKINNILKLILDDLEEQSGSGWKSVKISESHPIYQFYNEKTHRSHSHAIMIGNKDEIPKTCPKCRSPYWDTPRKQK